MKEIYMEDENVKKDFKGKHALFIGIVAIGLCFAMINTATNVEGILIVTAVVTGMAIAVMASWAFGWYDDNEPTNDEAVGGLWESYASNMRNSTKAIQDSKATEIYNLATLLNATREHYAMHSQAKVIEYNLINESIWGSWGTDEDMIVTEPFYANMGDMAGSFSQSVTNYLSTLHVLDDQMESDSETKCDIELHDDFFNTYLDNDWEGFIAGISLVDGQKFYGKAFYIMTDYDTTSITVNVSQYNINTETGTYDEEYLFFDVNDDTIEQGLYYKIELPKWSYYKINSPVDTTRSDGEKVFSGYSNPNTDDIAYILTQGVLYDTPNEFIFKSLGKDEGVTFVFDIDIMVFKDTYNNHDYLLYLQGTPTSIKTELKRWSNNVEDEDSYIRNIAQTYKNILRSFGWNDVDEIDETYFIPSPVPIIPPFQPDMNYTEMLIMYYAWLDRVNETLNKGWNVTVYDVGFTNIKTHVWVTVEHSTRGIIINNTESIIMPHSHAVPVFVNTSFQPTQKLYIYAFENKVIRLYNIIGTAEITRSSEYTITVHRITEDGVDVDESIILYYTMDEYLDTEYPDWDVPDITPGVGGFDWLTGNMVTIACGILTGVSVIIYFWKQDITYLYGGLLFGALTVTAFFVIDPMIAGTFDWSFGWSLWYIDIKGVR